MVAKHTSKSKNSDAMVTTLTTMCYFAVWFALNALFNVYNKRVLDMVGLPWTMTFVQLSTGFVLVLPLWILGVRRMPSLCWGDLRWLLPLGFYHFLSSAGGVHAINSGTVSTFQVLKAMEPIIAAILAAALFHQFFSWQVYATIVVVVYGIFHAFWTGWGNVQEVRPVMFFGTLISIIGAALRSLYSKQKLDQKMTPSNLFAVMNATSLLMLLPFAFWELCSVHEPTQVIGKIDGNLIFWAVLSGFFFYANNEVAFYALQKVHPITHAVANIIRRVIIIFVSVVFLNDTLTVQKAVGATIAIFGVFLYSIAKYTYGSGVATRPSFPSKRGTKLAIGMALAIPYFIYEISIIYSFKISLQEVDLDGPTKQKQHQHQQLQQQQQQLVHLLRANDMELNEVIHVFDRANELTRMAATSQMLPNAKTTNEIVAADAKRKVMCGVGMDKNLLSLLSRVWVTELNGAIGRTAPNHSIPATAFESCDIIISSGGMYESVSSWAFHSPIPVINLWNEDKYYPQDALLFAYRMFKTEYQGAGGFETDMLRDKKAFFSPSSISNGKLPFKHINNWHGPPELMAAAEVSRLFQFDLVPCPSQGECLPRLQTREVDHTDPAPALLAAMAEFTLAKAGSMPNSYLFPGIRCDSSVTVSGKVNGHDPHFVYGKDGAVLFALEWERVTRKKYSIDNHGRAVGFDHAARSGSTFLESNFNISKIDLFLIIRTNEAPYGFAEVGGDSPISAGEKDVLKHFPGVPIIYKEQLKAHAVHGFFDSPFRSALVVSIHGGGSEPYSAGLYLARSGMQPILLKVCDNRFMNMGLSYMGDAGRFSEVESKKKWTAVDLHSWSGTFMGYSALGKPLPCIDLIQNMLLHSQDERIYDPLSLIQKHCNTSWAEANDFPKQLPVEVQRDIAYTYQELFEQSFLHIISQFKSNLEEVDGIVIAGGSALNVKVTQRVWNTFHKPVWVASAPSDNGLGAGGVWSICQPPPGTTPLQYHGLPLLDKKDLPERAKSWGDSCEYLGMDEKAATRLAKLIAIEKRIIAVVIGNQEYGPRALSHRSLMAYPDSIEIRERMNALKFRQFYRPTCPTMAEEFVGEMFVQPETIRSPFMSFAPQLQEWVEKDLPAVRHYDGTARPQTLSKSREPFIHAMLTSIPEVKRDGKPVVINTSFNIKGQPIINTLKDSLFMLCDRPQLDYLFVDGYLFSLPGNSTHPECSKPLQ